MAELSSALDAEQMIVIHCTTELETGMLANSSVRQCCVVIKFECLSLRSVLKHGYMHQLLLCREMKVLYSMSAVVRAKINYVAK